MAKGLNDKVRLQIEEILKGADRPEIDVKAILDRASEILEERLPGFLVAVVVEALEEQLAEYNRYMLCKHFRGLYFKCSEGKMVGEACLDCKDYKRIKHK